MTRRVRALLTVPLLALSVHTPSATATASDLDRAVELRLLAGLASASRANRPAARWNYANFLITRSRAAEAFGVLEAMRIADPALEQSAPFLALRGRSLLSLRRYNEALGALSHPDLLEDPNACLLRMQAYDRQGRTAAAVAEWGCIQDASHALSPADMDQARLTAAGAYVGIGQLRHAEALLSKLGSRLVPEVAYWRGVIALRDKRARDAKKLFGSLDQVSDPRLRLRAAMGSIDARLQLGTIAPTTALGELDKLRFQWRGGGIERDAITRMMLLSEARGDAGATLAHGVTLFRYFKLGPDTPQLLARLRAVLFASVDQRSPLPLAARAGLLWDYRDLLPLGGEGDDIIRSLANQLADAGLYIRAADLFAYQLENRLAPGAGSSIGLQAAEWRMIVGRPDLALTVLDASRSTVIDTETAVKRDTVAAFALLATGRGNEAYALLDGRAGQLPIAAQAELFWQAKDWRRFLDTNARQLPARGAPVEQGDRTIIIRHAIAATSILDTGALAELSRAYGAPMARGPLSTAFAVLTQPEAPITPPRFEKALTDLAEAVPPPRLDAWLVAFTGTHRAPTDKGPG